MNFEYKIFFSKRKTISIEIKKDLTVKVSAPKFCSEATVRSFVESKTDWISKKVAQVKSSLQINNNYTDGGQINYLGTKYNIKIEQSITAKNSIEIIDQTLLCRLKNITNSNKVIKNFLLQQAKIIFQKRLDNCYANFINKQSTKVLPVLRLRFMKTRWGSMSSSGIMCLNVSLIHLKTELIDYVINHELCHIIHQNHSAAFYDLFTKIEPNWKIYRKEMKCYKL